MLHIDTIFYITQHEILITVPVSDSLLILSLFLTVYCNSNHPENILLLFLTDYWYLSPINHHTLPPYPVSVSPQVPQSNQLPTYNLPYQTPPSNNLLFPSLTPYSHTIPHSHVHTHLHAPAPTSPVCTYSHASPLIPPVHSNNLESYLNHQ